MAEINALERRMATINAELVKEKKKKEDYQKLLNAANGTKSPLSSACSNLSSAESNLKNGGYTQEGINLKTDNLEGYLEDLNSIISKTEAKIEEIDSKIARLQSEYEEVHQQYLTALNAG